MGSVNELMTELADAVRLKSGETGELTIKQMVTAMAGITVSGDIGFKCGTFTAGSTGASRTVSHGLGQKPGAIIFVKKYSYESSSSSATTTTSVYDALVSIVFGEDSGHAYAYNTIRKTSSSSSSGYTTTRYWTNSSTIPSVIFGSGTATNYYVTNINDTTFTTPKGLISGRQYFWIAFRAPLI